MFFFFVTDSQEAAPQKTRRQTTGKQTAKSSLLPRPQEPHQKSLHQRGGVEVSFSEGCLLI